MGSHALLQGAAGTATEFTAQLQTGGWQGTNVLLADAWHACMQQQPLEATRRRKTAARTQGAADHLIRLTSGALLNPLGGQPKKRSALSSLVLARAATTRNASRAKAIRMSDAIYARWYNWISGQVVSRKRQAGPHCQRRV